MLWLEAHVELLNHPKTAVLGASMGWNKFETVGRLMAFWWWCLQYAPTGDLRKFTDEALGAAVVLNGEDARSFVKEMVAACWLDRTDDAFRVHDWPDFTKRYLRDSKFKDKPEKWAEVLSVYKDNAALKRLQSSSGVTNGTSRGAQKRAPRADKKGVEETAREKLMKTINT